MRNYNFLKKIILTLSLLLVAGIGYLLFDRYQNEILWGHYPFVFLLALWVSIVLIFEKKYTNNGTTANWLAWSTLSGLLLAVGFPPLPLPYFLLIGMVPLLLLEQKIADTRPEDGGWQVFKYSYNTFVVWNILTTWWVANTAFFASFIAIWLNSFFMTIPFLLYHFSKKRFIDLSWIPLIAFWMSFEMIHLRWEISWTWLNLGNGFASMPSLIQWYEYFGATGGTVWILSVNWLIFNLLRRNGFQIEKPDFTALISLKALKIYLLIGLPMLYSVYTFLTYEEKGRPVKVAVIQPNYEPHYEKFSVSRRDRLQRFTDLTASVLDDSVRYIAFPETSFSRINTDNINVNSDIRGLRNLLADYPNARLISGVSAYNVFNFDEPHTRAVRRQERTNAPDLYYEALNAAIQIDPHSDTIPIYLKSKLVPGAEITPYREVFFFVQPLMEHLDGSVEGLGIQEDRVAFEGPFGNIAPVICYESIYGEYTTEYIKAGAEAIFVLTNDGWWDNTAGHKQHLVYSGLRAIETRKPVARSANTGISAFIDQRGVISDATTYETEAAIAKTIYFNNVKTFYVKYGDVFGRISLLVAGLLLLNMIFRRLRGEEEEGN